MLLWPLVFVMTDVINEYFGRRGVCFISFPAAGPICYAFLFAFLIGQLIDVGIFHRIRAMTGERWIWLRATGSTAVSQLVDSFVVLYIAFVLGPQQWPVPLFLAVGTVNYCCKLAAAIALIPLIYLMRRGIERYLGEGEAERLKEEAGEEQGIRERGQGTGDRGQ